MSIKRGVLLALLVALAALVVVRILQVPRELQYVTLAPKMALEEKKAATEGEKDEEGEAKEEKEAEEKEKKDSALVTLLKGLDNTLQENAALSDARMAEGMVESAQLKTSRGGGVTARVIGLWGDTHVRQAPLLAAGRLLYQEELEAGSPVAVLDEQTAVKLFRSGAPVGEKFTLNEKEYTVAGIIRHTRTPGDREPLRVHVPLLSLDKLGLQADTLAVSLRILPGQGAATRLKTILESWQKEGTLYNLSKERYRSLLPFRWLLCALGVMVLWLFMRGLVTISQGLYAQEKRQMESRYVSQRLHLWVLKGAGILLLWAAWLAGLYLVLNQAIAPVYMFPEWVPAVLVEPKDIATAFWNNRAAVSRLVEIRTPEIIDLRFYHRLSAAASVAIFILLLKPYHHVLHSMKDA